MQRRRIPITDRTAYLHLGEVRAYQQALLHLSEIPTLYDFDDSTPMALAAHQVALTDLLDEAHRALVVAAWVHCGVDQDIDLDSAVNCRFVVDRDGLLYVFAAFLDRYEMPPMESLKRPRSPARPDPLDPF